MVIQLCGLSNFNRDGFKLSSIKKFRKKPLDGGYPLEGN